jgi:apolipoprotein N-acyltransferase
LAAVASGLLLTLAYPPLDQGWLAPFALLPWLIATCGATPTRAARDGLAFGLAFQALGLVWITHVTTVGYMIAVIVTGWWFAPLAAVAVAARQRGIPLVIALPPLWVAAEWGRSQLLGGFIWFFLGHSQWRYPLAQVADLGGVWLLSAMLAAFAGALADVLAGTQHGGLSRRVRWSGLAAASSVLLLGWCYGCWRLQQASFVPGPRLGLIQGNIPQAIKLERMDTVATILEPHVALTRQLAQEHPRLELIIWPETMMPGLPLDIARDHDFATRLARTIATPLLLGTNRLSRGGEPAAAWREHNTILHFDATGELLGLYDKRQLVQGGEYLPLRDVLPWVASVVRNMVGYVPDLTPGTALGRFATPQVPFGVVICNESTFPGLTRELAANGARFIINPTNDGWFEQSAELDQVVAICCFRAIENRVSFIRAANTGISCFIDPCGRVQRQLEVAGAIKAVRGTLVDTVQLDDRQPPQRWVGDAVAYIALALTTLLVGWCRRPIAAS